MQEQHFVQMSNGTRVWFHDKKLHRDDGPAIEYADGRGDIYYINGAEISFNNWVKLHGKFHVTGKALTLLMLKYSGE